MDKFDLVVALVKELLEESCGTTDGDSFERALLEVLYKFDAEHTTDAEAT